MTPEASARGVFPRFDRVAKEQSGCCYLTITAVEAAAEQLSRQFHDTPRMIIAPQSVADAAAEVCDRLGMGLVLVPDAIMKTGGWVVVGETSMIWSQGE